MNICAVVPCAGKGTRLGLDTSKILLPIGNKTVLDVLKSKIQPFVDRIVWIISPKDIIEFESRNECFVVQEVPTGMADAVFLAEPIWKQFDRVLVIWGDQVNISKLTIAKTVKHKETTVPMILSEKPYIQYDFNGPRLVAVRQTREGDATDTYGLSDIGVFLVPTKDLIHKKVIGKNTGESNFTPLLVGKAIKIVPIKNKNEARGINTLEDLEFARRKVEGD